MKRAFLPFGPGALVLGVIVSGCAHTEPKEMSAAEHREEAAKHTREAEREEQEAAEHAKQ